MNIISAWKQRRAEKRVARRAKARSDEIDRQLQEESTEKDCGQWRQNDILLIGTPESEAEAFAFVKRMKLVHDDYTSEQLDNFRPIIWKILLDNSRTIVHALLRDLDVLDPEYLHPSTKANCEYIMNHRSDTENPDFLFLPRFAQAVQDLWTKVMIPMLLDQPSSGRFSLGDNAEYFFAETQRITAEDYVPSIEDIDHTSKKGIMETFFDFNHHRFSIRISQVYGQSGHFGKWIHLFEGIMSLMFCVSLSNYDEPGVSNLSRNQQTRLMESLTHFETVVNLPWLTGKRINILLFLTGMEEFSAKLHEVPLNKYFPEYTGGPDVARGADYICMRFRKLNHLSLPLFSLIEVSDLTSIWVYLDVIQSIAQTNHLRVADLM